MQNLQNDSFFKRVYEVARLIPYGRVTSYGAIARYLGTAGSARMVGWAMNHSSIAPPYVNGKSHIHSQRVPAHRVVNRNGMLTGKRHFGGSDIMRQLLESEGIEVIDDKVKNFYALFWDPMKELK